jgi:hypothetical protein
VTNRQLERMALIEVRKHREACLPPPLDESRFRRIHRRVEAQKGGEEMKAMKVEPVQVNHMIYKAA